MARTRGKRSLVSHLGLSLLHLGVLAMKDNDADSLNKRGTDAYRHSQYLDALDYYQQALIITREAGDRAMEGTTLNYIGLVYRALGQYGQALENYQQALDIAREVGNRPGEGATLNNIGAVYQSRG